MPAKLSTTINNIQKKVHNNINRNLITELYNYLASIDTSESYQNGLLKVIIRFAEYLGPEVTFYKIQNKEQILKFLDLFVFKCNICFVVSRACCNVDLHASKLENIKLFVVHNAVTLLSATVLTNLL